MFIKQIRFNEIRLQYLVDSNTKESTKLTYLDSSVWRSWDSDNKILENICSLANGIGGSLFIGIKSSKDATIEFDLVQSDNFIVELSDLGSKIINRIEPDISGLMLNPIKFDNGYVVEIFVPQSCYPPHIISSNLGGESFVKMGAGIREFQSDEIRSITQESSKILNFAMKLIENKQKSIESELDSNVYYKNSAVLSIHLVPIADCYLHKEHSIEALKKFQPNLIPLFSETSIMRTDFKGLISTYERNENFGGFVHVSRDGLVESVCTCSIKHNQTDNEFIPGLALITQIYMRFQNYYNGLKDIGVSFPIILNVSLYNLDKTGIIIDNFGDLYNFQKNIIHLNNAIIFRKDSNSDILDTLISQFDQIWNAFGIEKCSYKYNNGKFE